MFLCRKQTKYIQEQLKEVQNGKTYSLNASSIMAKTETRAQSQIHLQNVSKRASVNPYYAGWMLECWWHGHCHFFLSPQADLVCSCGPGHKREKKRAAALCLLCPKLAMMNVNVSTGLARVDSNRVKDGCFHHLPHQERTFTCGAAAINDTAHALFDC